jgi:predicted nucleic acid-binding protein
MVRHRITMEGEESAPVNIAGDEEEEPVFGLRDLLGTLLDRQTLPHVLLLTLLSSGLFALTSMTDGAYELTSLAFLSLSLGYALTAVLTRFGFVHDWVRTDASEVQATGGIKGLALRSAKVWSLPLLLAAAIAGGVKSTLLADGAYAAWPALGLAGLFIVWSAGQAGSFRTAASSWLSGSRRSRDSRPGPGSVGGMFTLHMLALLLLAGALAFLFGYGARDPADADFDTHLRWVGFVLVVGVIQFGILRWLRAHYEAAAVRKGSARFALRWGIVAQAFVTWHMLSAWRRFIDPPSAIAQLFEETILMVFAVVMAIWALSSRGVKKGSKLFSSDNALFWGLAFGFGYAGSIAMITRLSGGGLATTMGFGHLVTAGALILMHPAVITRHNTLLATTSEEEAEVDSDPDSQAPGSVGPESEPDGTQDEVELAEPGGDPEAELGSWPEDEEEDGDWELDESDFDDLELLD